jgi:hypothetical protein
MGLPGGEEQVVEEEADPVETLQPQEARDVEDQQEASQFQGEPGGTRLSTKTGQVISEEASQGKGVHEVSLGA